MSIRPFNLAFGSLLALRLAVSHADAQSGDRLSLIPWPQQLHLSAGQFEIKPAGHILAADKSLVPLAKVLAEEIESRDSDPFAPRERQRGRRRHRSSARSDAPR